MILLPRRLPSSFLCLAHVHVGLHEQQNAIVKWDAGIINFSENESALKRWMVAGPEIDRMLTEYDMKYTHNDKETNRHHD